MEEHHTEHKKPKKKINIWKIISAVLAILLIVSIFTNGLHFTKSVSKNQAEEKILTFLKEGILAGAQVSITEIEDIGNLYKLKLEVNGNEYDSYLTKDAKLLFPSVIDITQEIKTPESGEEEIPKEIPKTDKPKVETFIFSYCPYGLQFEKALFPVYDLLKDKVDFNIVAIGAMHGEFEKVETLKQISIEKLYGKNKLFSYLKEFDASSDIGSCSGDETCLNKYLPAIYTKLGIDNSKVESYIKVDAVKTYDDQSTRANSLGISGSPGFVVNGAEVQVARNPNAIKEVVCAAFNNEPPECSETLSSVSPSPGFGSGTGSASSTAQC